MNTKLTRMAALVGVLGFATVQADSTFDSMARHSYGANIGWLDWKYDVASPEGVSVEPYLLRGKAYAANIGWIDLGDGQPNDGVFYSHVNGDWGVNHDGVGGLTGWAYGANVGWILFSDSWKGPAKVNLKTGALSGYAYSANVGWIGLDGLETGVDEGADIDSDGIADAWEYEQLAGAGMTADLSLLGSTASSDADGDGVSDIDEYAADTDPFDNSAWLQITSFVPDFTLNEAALAWTYSPRRIYSVWTSTTLAPFVLEEDEICAGSVNLSMGTLPTKLFFRVKSSIPLAP